MINIHERIVMFRDFYFIFKRYNEPGSDFTYQESRINAILKPVPFMLT